MSSPQTGEQHVPKQFHVTRSFAADFGELEARIGSGPAKVVYDRVVSALEAIRDQKPPDTLPIKPYGHLGDTFQYRLDADYVFTFKRATDRQSEGRPILFHYYLKNLFRQGS